MNKLSFALVAAVAVAVLGACTPSVDGDGFHTQRARAPGGMDGGMFGGGKSGCNAATIDGCGGVTDRDDYQRLGAAGKLRFTYPDGSTRVYQPN